MTDRELMQQALDYLDAPSSKVWAAGTQYKIIQTLRARLAQPEQDYEAKFINDWNEGKVRRVSDGKRMVPQRDWQGLTAGEIKILRRAATNDREFADLISAKLKEKNNG